MINELYTKEDDYLQITGHEYHQLHESFSPAKNKISVICIIRG
jgi:hypothetical protein